jgi:hypothetical protein
VIEGILPPEVAQKVPFRGGGDDRFDRGGLAEPVTRRDSASQKSTLGARSHPETGRNLARSLRCAHKQSGVSSLEHGAGVDVVKLPELAAALDCTVSYLLGLTADPHSWEPDGSPETSTHFGPISLPTSRSRAPRCSTARRWSF